MSLSGCKLLYHIVFSQRHHFESLTFFETINASKSLLECFYLTLLPSSTKVTHIKSTYLYRMKIWLYEVIKIKAPGKQYHVTPRIMSSSFIRAYDIARYATPPWWWDALNRNQTWYYKVRDKKSNGFKHSFFVLENINPLCCTDCNFSVVSPPH